MPRLTNQDKSLGCSVCGVHIMSDGRVQFSNGNMGTRAQLYARVCKFTQNSACINQDKQAIGEVMQADGFPSTQESLSSKVYWQLFRT